MLEENLRLMLRVNLTRPVEMAQYSQEKRLTQFLLDFADRNS